MNANPFFRNVQNPFKNVLKWFKRHVSNVTENIIAAVILAILSYILFYFRDHITLILMTISHWFLTLFDKYVFYFVLITLFVALFFLAILIKQRKYILSWPPVIASNDFDILVSDISTVLEADGFSIANPNVKGVNLVGISKSTSQPSRVIVIVEKSTNYELKTKDIRAILYRVKKCNANKCYYITRSPRAFFTKRALIKASKGAVIFTTYQIFVLKGIEFYPYLTHLITEWKSGSVSKNYIGMSGRDEEGNIHKPLEALLDEKINRSSIENRVLLLGDFGTGKTTFLRYYAFILAQRFLENQVVYRIPIFISLKDYELVSNLEQLVARELGKYGVNPPFDITKDVQLRRKIIIILDAFDEMSLSVDRVSVQRNLRVVEEIVAPRSGAFIISCRKHFFRDTVEEGQFQNFSQIEVEPWGRSELVEYLQRLKGDKWRRSMRIIKETHNLEELARTPLFLNMIVDSITSFSGHKVLSAELYISYTNKWIYAQRYRAVLDSDQKTALMEELAWKMIIEGRRFISWPELRDFIQELYKLPITDIDRFDNDIRTCSFLTRSVDEKSYTFSHNSFLEFFVAKYVAKRVKDDNIEPLCEIELPYEVLNFLVQLIGEFVYYERIHLWLESSHYFLARRNTAQVLRIVSRSPLSTEQKKDRGQKIREQMNLVMSQRDTNIRWKAVITLGWLKASESLNVLQDILFSDEKDPRILRITPLVLGLLGDTSAAHILTKLLHDGQSYVIRQNCAVALGLLGETSTIPNLVRSLEQDEAFQVRRSAIWAVEIIDPVMARSTLTDRALNDLNEEVRQYAALALGRVGGSEALDTLENLMLDASPLVRRSALYAIGQIGGTKALRLAEKFLNDPDIRVKEAGRYAVNLIKHH